MQKELPEQYPCKIYSYYDLDRDIPIVRLSMLHLLFFYTEVSQFAYLGPMHSLLCKSEQQAHIVTIC